jgi:hypothetical protein
MISFSGETFIKRPAEEIFDFVADERNNYDPSFRRTEILTEGPIGVGTKFKSENIGTKDTVPMTVEITEYERPTKLSSITRLDTMDVHNTLVLEPKDDGTLLHWSSGLAPRGVYKLLYPVVALAGKRQSARIWENLKHTLEKRNPPEPDPTDSTDATEE